MCCLALVLVVFSFSLPSGRFGFFSDGPVLSQVFSSFFTFSTFIVHAVLFSCSDCLEALSYLSLYKLFYVSFFYDIFVGLFGLVSYVVDVIVVQFCWFTLSSLYEALRNASSVQDLSYTDLS